MPQPTPADEFPSTHWSLLADNLGRDRADDRAFVWLCQAYWYPIYAYIRRRVHEHDRAEDLTQGFFAKLLERGFPDSLDRSKGRFRAYLLGACKNFLMGQAEHDRAIRRGGGRAPVSIDADDAQRRYRVEPADPLTPEAQFDRHWAQIVLERAFEALRREYAGRGASDQFERLQGAVRADVALAPYAQIAAELGTTEAAVKKKVERLRARYQQLLIAEITPTVDDPDEVRSEIRALFTALAAAPGARTP